MYDLYLVNHTKKEFYVLCKSSSSQERKSFHFNSGWDREDDMEVMTQYVFKEKLKNRSKFKPAPDDEEYDEDEEEDNDKDDDVKKDYHKKFTEPDEEEEVELREDTLESKR
jgi:hypothetical protein